MMRISFIIFLMISVWPRVSPAQTTVKRTDFIFTVKDGTKLDCTKFFPDSLQRGAKIPVMIYVHGYGDSKDIEIENARAQAQFGYYTLCFSVRGQGKSTGLSNLISRTEMNDLFELVSFVKRDSLADSTHVGIFGASQGGLLPFMAICNGLDVTMIMSDLASPEFASGLIENGSIKITGLFTVDYDTSIVRYTPEVKNIRKWMLSKREKDWDSLTYYLPRNRDFMQNVKDNKVPVLICNAWQDKFFNTLGSVKATQLLTSPFVAYWGAMEGHGADTTFEENNFISNLDNAWMGYYLKGLSNPFTDSTRLIFAASRFPAIGKLWSFNRYTSAQWEPHGVTDIPFYFTPKGSLSYTPNAAIKDRLTLINAVRDPSLKMIEAIQDRFRGPDFDSKFTKHSIVFDSEPLTSDYLMAGTPKLNLTYASDARVCQYNFQIWEVGSNKESKLITRINYTDRHCTPGIIHRASIEGISHAHLFKAGDRIRIILTNLDTDLDDHFLHSNPHVLPVLIQSRNTVYMNKTSPSFISLPMMPIPTVNQLK